MVDKKRALTPAEIANLKRWAENWDKPLAPSVAVPKKITKKRGRPAKEEA